MTAAGTPNPSESDSLPAERSQADLWRGAPVDAALSVWTAQLGWLQGAVRRRLTFLGVLEDVAEWWRASTARSAPEWATEHRVVREWPEARLLDFSVGNSTVPTLVLPPQAGHSSTIVDYSAGQSQVRTAHEAGLDAVYSLDWKSATTETRDAGIETYIAILDDVVAELGGKANLVGDCQGGWLAVIYAALRPEAVHTLTIGGAPIDFHHSKSALHEWVPRSREGQSGDGQAPGSRDPMAPYRKLVELSGGVHRGQSQINGFKMLEPAAELERLMDLWAHIDDPAYVQRHVDFTNWFEFGQDLPGTFYLWIVEHLFIRNELVHGELLVDGEPVLLERIDMPVNLLAGTADHITPAGQVWALAEYVSTPPGDIHRELVEAGHLGLFMGRTSLQQHWLPLLRQVADHSRPADPATG